MKDCYRCTNGSKCLNCTVNKYLAFGNTSCISNCSVTYPNATNIIVNGVNLCEYCANLTVNCNTCTSATVCTSCTNLQFLNLNKTACISNCSNELGAYQNLNNFSCILCGAN